MYYRPQRFNFLPPVIKNLMIINGIVYLAMFVLSGMGINLLDLGALRLPVSEAFQPYQLVTHLFLHSPSGLGHIFFNMFALWMFGTALENLWGSQRFLFYYLVTGLGAALIHMGVWYWEYFQILGDGTNLQAVRNATILANTQTIGASGAVFGVLLAFGMTYPNQRIYLYFLMPIKAKHFVIGYGILELLSGLSRTGDGVAHWAHLGGMIFGYFLIQYWRNQAFRFRR